MMAKVSVPPPRPEPMPAPGSPRCCTKPRANGSPIWIWQQRRFMRAGWGVSTGYLLPLWSPLNWLPNLCAFLRPHLVGPAPGKVP